ncbi:hypothetical protein E2C01_055694 [Portunus trituberculatus]|uniref:Uncharacterized protein n=1 Tax=Portunus trituberculatus TaxID=210409 RepID=A0A5B7GN65_PORTR|nr:hypothetical protein [Portunus trituberculatus]
MNADGRGVSASVCHRVALGSLDAGGDRKRKRLMAVEVVVVRGQRRLRKERVWIISQGRSMFRGNYSLTSHAHPIYVCDFDSLEEKIWIVAGTNSEMRSPKQLVCSAGVEEAKRECGSRLTCSCADLGRAGSPVGR